LIEKFEGMISVERPGRREEDNIIVDLKDIGLVVDRIRLAQEKEKWRTVVSKVMSLRIP
jgi:hypothetical protein